ncbi:hypothetical protein PAXRUDRAFT_305231 [Paxillus rubicundulus Ve08.2h10]|uniref:Uncharacterized protein n=1 Tax=Paxillus rubicundulus Ve08.2h10 TaxID=930991 RepID=A0A0D0DFL2_9AGAM|nr:hypothetical protein PAXRUDRAFT_305231 [Paxillus rubicundulus Ve08.2h10]
MLMAGVGGSSGFHSGSSCCHLLTNPHKPSEVKALLVNGEVLHQCSLHSQVNVALCCYLHGLFYDSPHWIHRASVLRQARRLFSSTLLGAWMAAGFQPRLAASVAEFVPCACRVASRS